MCINVGALKDALARGFATFSIIPNNRGRKLLTQGDVHMTAVKMTNKALKRAVRVFVR